MAVNTTDYSSLEDAVRANIMYSVGSSGLDYVQDEAIRIYNGDIGLDGASFAEWGRTVHGPKVLISIENITDEEDVQEGGRHPRRTWQTVEMAIYLYDESLRGRGPAGDSGTRGLSGKADSPGVWKLINDVRAGMSGYFAPIHTLKWEGPFWTGCQPREQGKGRQLWRLACEFRGCIENSIDTTSLDDFDEANGDYNRIGSTANPEVEELISI